MREPFNRNAVIFMLQHADEIHLPKEDLASLDALLRKAGNSAFLLTNYTQGGNGGCDRWNACGVGLQGLQKKTRATICNGLWLDLDFVNCGPTLLLGLCRKYKLQEDEYRCLTDYVENREQRLTDGAPFVTRDDLKKVVIQMLYGKPLSNIKTEFDTGDNANELDGVEWLLPLERELRTIRTFIANEDEFIEVKSRFKHASNRDAKILAGVLFACENRCLEALYHYLQNQGAVRSAECVLAFDGIMVPASDRNMQRIGVGFLDAASEAIHRDTGFRLKIKKKPFTEVYELPDGFESTVRERYFQIQPRDDQAAADIFLSRLRGRLVKSNGRYFTRDENSVIFKEGEQAARDAIINMTKTDLEIVARQGDGPAQPYSKSTSKMNDCIPRILADKSIIDDKFTTNIWDGNLGYLAFTDGVYAFKDARLLTFDEAIERGVFFMYDTQRPFPASKGARPVENAPNTQDNTRDSNTSSNTHESAQDTVYGEFIRRVIEPLFPDADVRQHFFNCLARALAGAIHDKSWFALQGPRNSGKSTIYKLFASAFGAFVRMFGAENVLQRQNSQDAAKTQSWMKPLEFARVAFSNELKHTGMKPRFDGELLKRMCSNGDTIELRTNYKDEIQVRLQATFVLAFNNGCEADPPDAYQTMTGFKFQNEFHEPHEIDDTPGKKSWKKNWLPKDPALDAFIKRPDVVDAFTMFVLSHYTHDKQPAPAIVIESTNSLKGDAEEPMEERFGNIVKKTDNPRDVVFYKEIRLELARAGMGNLSHAKIDEYVLKLYGLKSNKPSKLVDGRKVQDRGFRGLLLNAHGFDEAAARITQNERVKQRVRCVTHDNFTPDDRIGSGT